MRALVQRVKSASVTVKDQDYKKNIPKGMLILLGITHNDDEKDVEFVADKCCNLRIFEDSDGKLNLSLKDIGGEALIISQFTLYGDTRKGNRPNFTAAARPEIANDLYEKFITRTKENLGDEKVKNGIFAANMDIELNNYGPVTILVESKEN